MESGKFDQFLETSAAKLQFPETEMLTDSEGNSIGPLPLLAG
jgi:hypothetical protein